MDRLYRNLDFPREYLGMIACTGTSREYENVRRQGTIQGGDTNRGIHDGVVRGHAEPHENGMQEGADHARRQRVYGGGYCPRNHIPK